MSQPEKGSSEPRPIDDNEIFFKIVGGVKKSRLYSIGSKISTYYNIASFSSTSPATSYSHGLEDQLQHVQEENKLLRDQFKDLQDQHQICMSKTKKYKSKTKKCKRRCRDKCKSMTKNSNRCRSR